MFFRNFKSLVFVIAFFPAKNVVSAPIETTLSLSSNDIQVSGPADSYGFATIFGNTGSRVYPICNNRKIDYTLSSIVYENSAVWTGQTYNGNYLFNSGINGLALVLRGAMQPKPIHPLGLETETVWTGSMDSESRSVLMTSQVYIYKDEGRLTGTTILPEQPLHRYLCKDNDNVTQEIYTVMLRPLYIHGSVTGCTPNEGSRIVEMDKIPIATMENASANSYIGTKHATFLLQCDPNIVLKYSVVDLSDQSNTSTMAKLTKDSTATGVGFAVLGSNGSPRVFGPDGSAVNTPGVTQYIIGIAGESIGKTNIMSNTLGFSYVRDLSQNVKPGSAKAMIGITYSYQ